jgi:hypothetical protein
MCSLPRPRPRVLVIRCGRCGGALAHYADDDGLQGYCPDCLSYAPAPERAEPPAVVCYTASTAAGDFVHAGPDLDGLVEWVRGLLTPGEANGDVVVTAGDRVVAIVTGCGVVARIG